MLPRVKMFLDDNPAMLPVFESVVSSTIRMIEQMSGETTRPGDHDMREMVRDQIGAILESVRMDHSSWPYVKGQMSYDEYLSMRKATGTITAHDLVRPGLTEANFSNEMDYYEHYGRVLEAEKKAQSIGGTMKITCNRCGIPQFSSSFRKGKGRVCNSCRGKAYRAGKKNKPIGVDNDIDQ